VDEKTSGFRIKSGMTEKAYPQRVLPWLREGRQPDVALYFFAGLGDKVEVPEAYF
jgi:hypothetical protein